MPRGAVGDGHVGHGLEKERLLPERVLKVCLEVRGEPQVAVQPAKVEQVGGLVERRVVGLPDPGREEPLPGGQGVSPLGVGGHEVALAAGKAAALKRVDHEFGKAAEVFLGGEGFLVAAGICVDDGVVLVGLEGLLLAARAAVGDPAKG